MLSLKGNKVLLRALEPQDLDFLYQIENDPGVWEISGTTTPYSKHVMVQYLANAHRDIYEIKQLRLCICTLNDQVLGLIDLFDFDPKNHRAGLGILIKDHGDRNKGLGAEAIGLVCDYAFSVLALRQVYANILEDNEVSLHLFQKLGFEKVGLKKDWIYSEGNYKNEIMFQKLNR